MNQLDDIIHARIAQNGPMPVSEYMALCLTHPDYGYYTTRDPLGAAGDFTTSPEISQMFGEMIGLWLAQTWLNNGRPTDFVLVEMGPGRGTLMADVLRAVEKVPGFLDAARVFLMEVSPHLKAKQKQALSGHKVKWIESANDLPDIPIYLIANEFFDALPIDQFIKTEMGWQKRFIVRDSSSLNYISAKPVIEPELDKKFPLVAEGRVVESAALAESIISEVAQKIQARGGAALIIDYGEWTGIGDTLQAVLHHQPVDALNHPHGEADLSAHVNFSGLAHASGLRPHFTTQGGFLESMGITARAQRLAAVAKNPDVIVAAHRRLTHPDEMGTLFKVLALTPETAPEPVGFVKNG